jgi:hypothetical protein
MRFCKCKNTKEAYWLLYCFHKLFKNVIARLVQLKILFHKTENIGFPVVHLFQKRIYTVS